MNSKSSWDFRDSQELVVNHEYNKEGFIIEKVGFQYLELIEQDIEKAYLEFANISDEKYNDIDHVHHAISHEESYDLRLCIM